MTVVRCGAIAATLFVGACSGVMGPTERTEEQVWRVTSLSYWALVPAGFSGWSRLVCQAIAPLDATGRPAEFTLTFRVNGSHLSGTASAATFACYFQENNGPVQTTISTTGDDRPITGHISGDSLVIAGPHPPSGPEPPQEGGWRIEGTVTKSSAVTKILTGTFCWAENGACPASTQFWGGAISMVQVDLGS